MQRNIIGVATIYLLYISLVIPNINYKNNNVFEIFLILIYAMILLAIMFVFGLFLQQQLDLRV